MLVSFKPEENNKVEVKLIARTEFVDSSMTLFCAVVEKEVQQTSPNGETVSYNILREFLPDPAGTLLNKDWLEDEAQTFSFNIGTDKIKDSEQVRVIAFVQNINSGIVYQAGANDISPLTGIEDDISGKSLSIYPNPVNEQLIFESGEDIKMVELFDVSGRLVKTYQPNSSLFSTSVEYLKDGVYIIRVKTINEIYTRKITKY